MEERLTVFVDPAFKSLQQVIFRTIEQLLEIAGWRCVQIDDLTLAQICYSHDPKLNRPIPCAGVEAWSALSSAVPEKIASLTVPSSAVISQSRS